MRFIVSIICLFFTHPYVIANEKKEDLGASIRGLTCTQVVKVELNTESGAIPGIEGGLNSKIADFLTIKKPTILSIVGKRGYLRDTLLDIAKIQDFKPETLDLDLFCRGEDVDVYERDIHSIFNSWAGTRVIFRMNDKILRDFRIGDQHISNTLPTASPSLLALLIFSNLLLYWYFN